MRKALQLGSWLALAGIVVPPILYFNGIMTPDGMKVVMLGASVLWFAVTPFWMNRGSQA